MVLNTSELLPEPETPVNTVSRRFGISMLTSLRLFSLAPCTRIRSWLSAACSAGDCVAFLVAVLVAVLIVSPSVGQKDISHAEEAENCLRNPRFCLLPLRENLQLGE